MRAAGILSLVQNPYYPDILRHAYPTGLCPVVQLILHYSAAPPPRHAYPTGLGPVVH
jgi:hypothetical protein